VALGEDNVAPDTTANRRVAAAARRFCRAAMNASSARALWVKPFMRAESNMRTVLIGAIAIAIMGGVVSAQGALGASQDGSSRDRVPSFNVEPSCEGPAARSTVPIGATENTAEVCIRKEMDARDQMTKEWDKFAASDKSYCVPLSGQGGKPTYTELLTCLELAREARNLKDNDMLGTTTGMGGGSSRERMPR
jgi:hypothetical protein